MEPLSARIPSDLYLWLAQLKVEGAAALCSGGSSSDAFLRLWPHLHATDGFFAAVWTRH